MKLSRYLLLPVVVQLVFGASIIASTCKLKLEVQNPTLPVLINKNFNPTIRLDVIRPDSGVYAINECALSLAGTLEVDKIQSISLCQANKQGLMDTTRIVATVPVTQNMVLLKTPWTITTDTCSIWVSVRLANTADLSKTLVVTCTRLNTNSGVLIPDCTTSKVLRLGVAVRQHGQDKVHTSRIPGLVTSRKGTLLAVFDARWDSSRDLQGAIDIGLHRSTDRGHSWQPLQIALGMGEWGGLPHKYNGVSDACILMDDATGDLFVAGLWMHGVLNPDSGEWIENLTSQSRNWAHQWIKKGSQPGLDVKHTCQFLIAKSTDDGISWGTPVNITSATKRPEWWLYAPAPGHGITLKDGTLVFPSQGRDKTGMPFSTITRSKDHGNTWTVGNPAFYNTTECMAVQLNDGSIMLNMRDNRNRNNPATNGRRICVTSDMGLSWAEHATSGNTLIEPTCMASIHKHYYKVNGIEKSLLFFSNPNDKFQRINQTIKVSFDDGKTWPQDNWVVLDAYKSAGYSCLTSIDDNTLGILYESSQADLVFQQIDITEILMKNEKQK